MQQMTCMEDGENASLQPTPSTSALSSIHTRTHLSLSGASLRLLLLISLVSSGVLLSFLGSASQAHAATDTTSQATTTSRAAATLPPTYQGQRPPSRVVKVPQTPNIPRRSAKTRQSSTLHPQTSVPYQLPTNSQKLDGLGDSSLYTFVGKQLSDRLNLKVNVANGNLVLQTTELDIKGTGLDDVIGGYYNSERTGYLFDHGTKWNFTTGRGVYLDLDNLSTDGSIILALGNGMSAYYAPDGKGGFVDAPGVGATLTDNGGGIYEVAFHQSGEQWFFNQWGTRYEVMDKNGNIINQDYATNGDWNTLTDTQQRTVTTTHNSADLISTITDNTVVNSKTRSVSYGYDPTSNDLTSITDANNQQTLFGYDGSDNLTSIRDPQGHTTTIAYNSDGTVQSITDANQGVTTFTYNSGNTVVADPNTHATTYSYQSNLQVTSTTNALGHTTKSSFNALTYNVNSYTDALAPTGGVTNFTYDSSDTNNKVTQEVDPSGTTTKYTYPTTAQNQQSGNTPNVAYSPSKAFDAQNNETDFGYDANGNLLNTKNVGTGNQSSCSYNKNGTPSGCKDGNGNVTTYGYDGNGNLTSVTPPSPLGKTTLTYDALSRVSSETDGNNHKTTFTYDALDRIQSITYNTGNPGSYSVSYTYDNDGNVLTQVDSTGTTSFGYDALNRQTTKTLPNQTVVTNGYDKVGNLTSLKDTSGTVTYTYDQVNRMTTLTDADGLKTTYTYDNDNRKTSMQYPNGTGQVMTYDGAGRATSIIGGKGSITIDSNGVPHFSGTQYSNFGYTYTSGSTSTDLLQKETALEPLASNATYNITYGYDAQQRLLQQTETNGGTQVAQWNAVYDANGNRTTFSLSSSALTYNKVFTYNTANELTKAVNTVNAQTTTYGYDGNGNLTSDSNGTVITYNAADQSTSMQSNSSHTETTTYTGTSQAERVAVNSTTDLYSSLGLSRETNASGSTEYVRCSCGLLNSLHTPDGKKYYYLFDGQGSIVAVTDSAGNAVDEYQYNAWGEILKSTVGVAQPWVYAGGYDDAATGTYKFGIRYYSPTDDRWTQATPIGGSLQEVTKANPYTYADNNPANEVDPSGASPIDVFVSCVSSGISGFIAILGNIAMAVGALGTGIVFFAALATGLSAAAAAAAVPAWLPILAGVGAAVFLGVVALCTGEAIAAATHGD